MAENTATHETRLLKVSEAAERANISRAHAYRLIERGELPALRVGNAVRVDEDELEQWLYAPPKGAA